MSTVRITTLDVEAGVHKLSGWRSNAGEKSRNVTPMHRKVLVPLPVAEATGRRQARQITRSSALARQTIRVTARERYVLSTVLHFSRS